MILSMTNFKMLSPACLSFETNNETETELTINQIAVTD